MSLLPLSRPQILAFRRRAGALDERLASGEESLRIAAWAGLQDSMPRAAVLSLHARVAGIGPSAWEHPSLVQVWGPRYQVYVVAAKDVGVFTLGRMPEDEKGRRRAEEAAERLRALLAGEAAAGGNDNSLRYAATTGTVLIRWDGARRPTARIAPPPDVDRLEARLELARRYLHVYGPATPGSFARWAGVSGRAAAAAFELLRASLTQVQTPVGDGWILTADEPACRSGATATAPARLLPSGDAYFLLQAEDRELLVPDPALRSRLWTPRVWPGALLVGGEIRGTWRRAHDIVTLQPWGRLSAGERDAVEAEAAGLPLPGLERGVAVRWEA